METELELDLDPTLPSIQLGNMRWVWSNPAGRDSSEGHRNARQLLNDNRLKFMDLMGRLEKEYREGLRAAQAEKVTDEDEGGEEKVEDLIIGLLRELNVE